MRGDSTLGWVATGLFLVTLPFVARAQLDDAGFVPDPIVDSGSPFADAGEGSTDASAFLDGGITMPDAEPGTRLPNGEPGPPPYLAADAGGCSCRATRGGSGSLAWVVLGALALRVRQRRGR